MKTNESTKKPKDNSISMNVPSASQEALERRRARFATKQNVPAPAPTLSSTEPIVGTCMVLEKAYFRLTTQPIASDIRPESVLKQAFKRLKSLWKSHYDMKYLFV